MTGIGSLQKVLLAPVFLLLTWTLEVEAGKGDVRPPKGDPFIDPKHDPWNPLKYIASNILTGVAFAIFLVIAISQSLCCWRWGAKWMLAMIIGSYAMALGFGIRFGLHSDPQSLGIYIGQYLFVVLSPCAFIAANYVLLGRLARHLDCVPFLIVPAHLLTRIFVTSDVITFLIQASGGGVSAAANDPHTNLIGSRIFLTGLAIQLASFFTFSVIYIVFLHRVRTNSPGVWTMDSHKGWINDWRTLAGVLVLSCIGILVRSVFRVVEASEGYSGHLTTTESFFYALDTLPLILAVAIYTPFWPGRFIPSIPETRVPDTKEQ